MKIIEAIALSCCIIGCLIGCNANSGDVKTMDYSDSIIIEPSPTTGKQLLPSMEYGLVKPPIAKDKAEKNLLQQCKEYNNALLLGDFENAKYYIYPGTIKYFRQFYQGETDDEIVNEFLKDLGKETSSIYQKFAKHDINVEICVAKFVRRIEYGNNIFIVFSTLPNVWNDNLYTHLSGDNLSIGISTDNGIHWKLNTMNEDTPNILRNDFSETVVDKIMSY